MCKINLISLAMLMLWMILTCPLVAQTETHQGDTQQHIQLMQNVMSGMIPGPQMLNGIGDHGELETLGITEEQMRKLNEKMKNAFAPFENELREKFGKDPRELPPDKVGEVVETMVNIISKSNDIADKIMRETFPAETIKKIDTVSFQKYGGIFGGALNVKNLGALNLTKEQKEKANQIIDKMNRERIELHISIRMSRPGEEPDIKGIMEKIISITRHGQQEIEALLTSEQKQQAKQLMVDIPDEYRFLNDYLTNRPFRLDESNWKPGDGAPQLMENYPGEVRPERPRGKRVFLGS